MLHRSIIQQTRKTPLADRRQQCIALLHFHWMHIRRQQRAGWRSRMLRVIQTRGLFLEGKLKIGGAVVMLDGLASYKIQCMSAVQVMTEQENESTGHAVTPTQAKETQCSRWSDDAAGCLCYYSTWYSPTISICDRYDDSSDTGSMVTIYSKSREVTPVSPLRQCTSMPSFVYVDSQTSSETPTCWYLRGWCCIGCCRTVGLWGV